MPLPPHALTITGGCNCGTIRYKIHIPPLTSRPIHENSTPNHPSGLEPVRQPFIFTDHCNDCRRAAGSILPAWISGPLYMFEASVGSPRTISEQTKGGPDEEKEKDEKNDGGWKPALDVFSSKGIEEKTSAGGRGLQGRISFYESSKGRFRTFCTTCGTPLTYWEEGLKDILDVQLGTIDREFLDTEDLRPERHLWWGKGIGWVKEYVDFGDGGENGARSVERHESDGMDERLGRGPRG